MSLDTESPFTLPFPPEPGERVSPGAVSPYHFEKIRYAVHYRTVPALNLYSLPRDGGENIGSTKH